MPDYRYRQTTVTLDVRGFEFRAAGRQPIEAGWRAAFPDWRPDDEKGEAAQALPVLRDGEVARLRDPEIEDKETRPPPRYKEGTLIEAMQNAWRFVGDEGLRERLKEATGIGTPATRAEIIAGLKRQGFLAAQGKNIVPTERGLALFGVLERADPGLVDPGVTAEMECLLDDVLTGRQEMMGAIDAVCDSARRIIGRLAARGDGGEALAPVNGARSDDDRPPTAAMKKYAASIAKRKGIKPPRAYTKSAVACRAFLDRHATGQSQGRKAESPESGPASGAPAGGKLGNTGTARSGKRATRPMKPRQRKPGREETDRSPGTPRPAAGSGTPLRIPYGNKELWRSVWALDTGRMAGMRRPAFILPPFASGDGCRGFRLAPWGVCASGYIDRDADYGRQSQTRAGLWLVALRRRVLVSGWRGCAGWKGIQHVTARRTMSAGQACIYGKDIRF